MGEVWRLVKIKGWCKPSITHLHGNLTPSGPTFPLLSLLCPRSLLHFNRLYVTSPTGVWVVSLHPVHCLYIIHNYFTQNTYILIVKWRSNTISNLEYTDSSFWPSCLTRPRLSAVNLTSVWPGRSCLTLHNFLCLAWLLLDWLAVWAVYKTKGL